MTDGTGLDLGRQDRLGPARDPVGRSAVPPGVQPRRPTPGGSQSVEGPDPRRRRRPRDPDPPRRPIPVARRRVQPGGRLEPRRASARRIELGRERQRLGAPRETVPPGARGGGAAGLRLAPGRGRAGHRRGADRRRRVPPRPAPSRSEPPDATSLLGGRSRPGAPPLEEADRDSRAGSPAVPAEDRSLGSPTPLSCPRRPARAIGNLLGRLLGFPEARSAVLAWQMGRIAGLPRRPVADAERVVRLIRLPADRRVRPRPRHVRPGHGPSTGPGQWEPARVAPAENSSRTARRRVARLPAHGHGRAPARPPSGGRANSSPGRSRSGDEHGEQATSPGDVLDAAWFEYDLHVREARSTIGTKGGLLQGRIRRSDDGL